VLESAQKDAIHSWHALYRQLDQAASAPSFDLEAWLATLDSAGQLPSSLARRLRARRELIESDDFLCSLPQFTEVPQPAARPTESAAPGDAIGPYRLQRFLGAGGMGSVWLAGRDDGATGRLVALKLVAANVMERERSILAKLDHPQIVRLHDAGITQDGRAYLALEYVDGEHIDRYCTTHRLSVPDRLALVQQVARLLAHSHARRVIHADLKPSNLLVDEDGRAHLVDFGIATFLDTAAQTRRPDAALTPSYAAPEQLSGVVPDVAADIFSLGVVLYELLTGKRPARDDEPAPPSEIADLNAIVLKALKHCPTQRYRSADELAWAIERCLAPASALIQPKDSSTPAFHL
jgi:serine/threonine-protein kinase